jgi:hypothetical protein
MKKKTKNTAEADLLELDPVIMHLLMQVHPMNLHQLLRQCLTILATITGLAPSHEMFVTLRTTRWWNELAYLDWHELAEEMFRQTSLSMPACQCAILPMQLLIERAWLHHSMYQAKSASTLRLYHLYDVSSVTERTEELSGIYDEFEQTIHYADSALHAGRALSAQFQREALQGAEYERLQTLVEQMHRQYIEYQQALSSADQLLSHIDFYLQALEQTNPSGGVQTGGKSIHAA